ncbi:MAG: M15 family metallopeptidase [Cyanobacteriota bacterium]|nr:M15 family metallopeptidase [Cyanobacteriota bacterium]
MKPYYKVPIHDCGEPLVDIPWVKSLADWDPPAQIQSGSSLPVLPGNHGLDHRPGVQPSQFRVVDPHPYQVLGAPYGDQSPYKLRSGVLAALTQAQAVLQQHYPHWGLQIFDAYRPLAVQKFMVDYTFQQLLQEHQLSAKTLSAEQHRDIMELVMQFWAMPSDHPAAPPPHSTGAAIDLTLVDSHGIPVAMGSAIDEISPRSLPNHYSHSDHPQAELFHHHRQLLNQVMTTAGFRRHPQEWWHFSLGDQLWAWLISQESGEGTPLAYYGRVA